MPALWLSDRLGSPARRRKDAPMRDQYLGHCVCLSLHHTHAPLVALWLSGSRVTTWRARLAGMVTPQIPWVVQRCHVDAPLGSPALRGFRCSR